MVSARFLLDTSVLSEPLRARPNASVMRRFHRHRDAIATAAPVWHELVFGCRLLPPSRKRQVIQRFLEDVVRATVPILPYDTAAAEWHAAERARLVGLGQTPPFVDGQIAAIASVHGLALVTVNVAHFQGFDGLTVEDWQE